jgi:hypothetical protein
LVRGSVLDPREARIEFHDGVPKLQQSATTKTELANATLVRIEELTRNPGRYDGMLVRVEALWINGYHGPLICPKEEGQKCIEPRIDYPSESVEFREIKKVLDAKLKPGPTGEFWDMRGQLTLVGRFKDTKTRERNRPEFVLSVLSIEAVTPKPGG